MTSTKSEYTAVEASILHISCAILACRYPSPPLALWVLQTKKQAIRSYVCGTVTKTGTPTLGFRVPDHSMFLFEFRRLPQLQKMRMAHSTTRNTACDLPQALIRRGVSLSTSLMLNSLYVYPLGMC